MFQQFPKMSFCPQKLAFRGANRDAEEVGDFGMRVAFEDVQAENGAKSVGQLLQNGEHLPGRRRVVEVLRRFVGQVVAVEAGCENESFLLPQMFERGVQHDFSHPAFEVSDARIARQIAENAHKTILQNVFRVFPRAGKTQAKRKHLPLEMLKKTFLSQRFAAKTAVQVGFRHVFRFKLGGGEIEPGVAWRAKNLSAFWPSDTRWLAKFN